MLPNSEALSQLVIDLYDAVSDPDLWKPFLQHLAESTGATAAGLVMRDGGRNMHTITHSWELGAEFVRVFRAGAFI